MLNNWMYTEASRSVVRGLKGFIPQKSHTYILNFTHEFVINLFLVFLYN